MSTPWAASTSGSLLPSLSVRPRSTSMSSVPTLAAEPNRLRLNRAPSSSAQSTRATVIGGVPSAASGSQQFQAGHHAERAVEPPALRHAVEMAADHQRVVAFAAQHGPQVAGLVLVDLDGKGGQRLAQHCPRLAATRVSTPAGDCRRVLRCGRQGRGGRQRLVRERSCDRKRSWARKLLAGTAWPRQTPPMSISVRTAVESDWAAICRVDGRAFGFAYPPELIERARSIHDISRFELAFDGKQIVAIVGAYSLKVTVPGGGQLPMGGLTWVSTAATHRRQGLLTRSDGSNARRRRPPRRAGRHAVGERGRDLRALRIRCGDAGCASRRSIGVWCSFGPSSDPGAGACRFVEGDAALHHMTDVWSRFHRLRAGEVDRSEAWHRFLFELRAEPQGGFARRSTSPTATATPSTGSKSSGTTADRRTTCASSSSSPTTGDAHAALWHTLLGVDLVGVISSRQVARRRSVAVPVDQPAGVADHGAERRHLGQRPRRGGVHVGAALRHDRSLGGRGRRWAVGDRRRAGWGQVQAGQDRAGSRDGSRLARRPAAGRRATISRSPPGADSRLAATRPCDAAMRSSLRRRRRIVRRCTEEPVAPHLAIELMYPR